MPNIVCFNLSQINSFFATFSHEYLQFDNLIRQFVNNTKFGCVVNSNSFHHCVTNVFIG